MLGAVDGYSLNSSSHQIEGIPLAEKSGSAVAVPETETAVKAEDKPRQKPKRQPRYNVVLWDDDDHTYAYVIAMMKELFGHPTEKAFQIAETVDTSGRAVCLTTTREHAELKRDQIHAYGKDPQISRCQGSMSATIEPLPEGDT
jgi:ATP-dependent Clp protease adaptor protein ClpS